VLVKMRPVAVIDLEGVPGVEEVVVEPDPGHVLHCTT
jgi:hypothetical protein